MKKINQKIQLGYTLVELSIGLAVSSLVIGSVIMGVEKLLKTLAVNRTVSQVAKASENIKLAIRRDPDASYVLMRNFTSGVDNAFPSMVVKDGGTDKATVYSALGNVLSLMNYDNASWNYSNNGATGYMPKDKQSFAITIGDVGPDVCYDLASALEGISNAVYFASNINSADPVLTVGQLRNFKTPFSGFDVTTARKVCGVNAKNVLIFQFQK